MAGVGDLMQATADSMNKASPGAVNVAGLEVAPVGNTVHEIHRQSGQSGGQVADR